MSRRLTIRTGFRRAFDFRADAVLDDNRTRRDQTGDFRVAEFPEQPEDAPINRFGP